MILLWGSNARETHPIFFHHLLKGVHNGARLFVVDPRRTSSAQWADRWLGLDVGSDIALSNTMAREIIHAGLANRAFVDHATEGFDAYAASVEPFTLAEGERLTGVPAEVIRETAHAFARADRAMICWTLGITEHHNAVDNVLALINLALLCGHVGRFGSGLNPLRGQNNVQGGGDMGAIPNKLPGFQDIERDDEARARFEQAWGTTIRPDLRLAPDPDVPRDGARRAADAVRDRREPGAVGGRHQPHAQAPRRARLPRRPGHRPDEDGRAGRRRLPVGRVVVRDRRHGDEQRAARAARAQGARPARRGARRHVDHRRARPPARPRLARAGRRGGLGRAALALADARRDELRAARGARRPPVAVPRRDASRLADPARAPLGRAARRPAGAVQRRRGARARSRRSTTTTRSGSRPAAGSSRTTPARRRTSTARRCTAASRSTSRPRTPSGSSSPTARSRASPRAAARSRRRCGSTRRCGPASRS